MSADFFMGREGADVVPEASPGASTDIGCLDPVVSFVLLVLVLHGAPGDPVGPALLAVLLLGRVVGRALDLLRVSGEVVPHAVRQIAQAVVGHDTSLSRTPALCSPAVTTPHSPVAEATRSTVCGQDPLPPDLKPDARSLTKMIPAGETLDHLSPTREDHP